MHWPRHAQARRRVGPTTIHTLAVAAALLVAALVFALAPADAAPADAVDSPPLIGLWSTGAGPDTASMDDLGVGWGRVTVVWSGTEPTSGHYDWSNLDQAFADTSGGGKRQILATIRNNPAWAAASRCTITTDAERANLARFVDRLVRRYSGAIPDGPLAGRVVLARYWQFYNEMDFSSPAIEASTDLGGCFATAIGFTPTQQGRDNYARMLETVGAAIRAADPDSKVVMGGVASSNYLSPLCPLVQCAFDPGFMQGVLTSLKNNGTLHRLDAVAVHYFSSQAQFWESPGAPDLVGRIVAVRQMMRSIGLAESQLKPIFVDEGSFTEGAPISTGDATNPYNRAQAAYVPKVLARAAFANVAAYFWFKRTDSLGPGLGGDWPFGLLDEQGAPKPAYGAYKYFASLVRSPSQSVRQLSFASPKLEGYELIASGGQRFQVVWNQADADEIAYAPTFGMGGPITDPLGDAVARSTTTVAVGAEPRFLFAPACTPRPPIRLAVTPGGANRLEVTVSATTQAGLPNNRLVHLRFGAGTNSVVDVVNGPTGLTDARDLDLPAVSSVAFSIRRANPAIGNAVVPLVVTDDCGTWPTFVGGGPTAWGAHEASGPSAPTPSAPPPLPPSGQAGQAAAVACTPRPAVAVVTAPDGPGRLRVTIAATGTGNALRELRVVSTTNAELDVGDRAGQAGARSVPLSDGTEQLGLLVRRVAPDRPVTVPLVVVDSCGEWPTLVGGGPNAF